VLSKSVSNYGTIITDLKDKVNDKASRESLHKVKMELTRFALSADLTELH
jgi:hypothetical protein